MCGIVAIWNRDGRPVDIDALRRGVESLAHRGPDGEGYVLIDTRSGRFVECAGRVDARPELPPLDALRGAPFDLALGHRRLAIVDLSQAGRQPMASPEGDVWIAFNGMVYNFADLRARLQAEGRTFRSRTDTEVLLQAYRQWGPDCVDRLNGMWAFVIWDARTRTLVASRDRLGIKPLVYHLSERVVAFSSEMKGLRPLLGGSCDVDAQALHHYLSLMQVPAPHTIDRRIRKLLPARMLAVSPRDAREWVYWRALPDRAGALDAREAMPRLEELLHDSVRLRLIADVRVGCLLSGGVDSSVVTALAAAAKGRERLTTFCIGFPGLPDVDETPWARRVAAHLGTEHVEIELAIDDVNLVGDIIRLYDEPFAVSSVLGVYLIARAARERVKILLSGDGGDELFAGYRRYLAVDERWDRRAGRALSRLRRDRVRGVNQWVRWRRRTTPERVRQVLHSLRVPDERGRDFEFNRNRVMFNDVEKAALYASEWRRGHELDGTIDWLCAVVPPGDRDRVRRRQLQELQTTLHDEMLAKVDRATMAWGIEARVPLLDYRVVELALSLPPECRYGGGEGKRLLKELGARYVPPEVVYREKGGFTIPLAEWLAGGLREFVRDTLAPAAVRRAGVFEPAAVADVIEMYARRPDFRTAHMLFTLLCFQVWYEGQGGGSVAPPREP